MSRARPLVRWHPVTRLALIASRFINYKTLMGAGDHCSHLIAWYEKQWSES
jgi:hypothetical protein